MAYLVSMMTYTEVDLNALFNLSQVGDDIVHNQLLDSATKKITCDKSMGDGAAYIFELPGDMIITFSDVTFKKPIVFKEHAKSYFGAYLVLDGSLTVHVPATKEHLTINKDEALFFVCHEAELAFHYHSGNTRYLNFCVPQQMMHTLLENQATEFHENSFFTVAITTKIIQVVDDIFRSELCSSAKSLYLQAKSHGAVSVAVSKHLLC